MKTYAAYFRSDAHYAQREFAAETPEQALGQARRLLEEHPDDLEFERRFDDDALPVNEIAICDADCNELAVWLDDELRMRLAARDLLEAAEKVVACWERGDLAEAVRDLNAAIAKAKEGTG